jgi:hypothetical protein
MKFVKDAVGGQQWIYPVPLFGNATNIKAGAAVIRGVTDGTNLGFGIIAPANTSMATGLFMGVTEALFAAATLDNDPSAGTKFILTQVTINPHAIYEAQYDNRFAANALTVTGVGATTVVSSGENLGGGWLFFDNYELHYVLSSSSGTYTTLTSTSAAITTANKVSKIYYRGQTRVTLITDGTQLGTATAAAGAIQAMVLDNVIRGVGYDNLSLDPTKHDNIILPSPNSVAPAIYAQLMFTQHFLIVS